MLKELMTAVTIAVCFATVPARAETPNTTERADQAIVNVDEGSFSAYARYHHRHWRYYRPHRHHRHHWRWHHHRHHGHHWGWFRGRHLGWFRGHHRGWYH